MLAKILTNSSDFDARPSAASAQRYARLAELGRNVVVLAVCALFAVACASSEPGSGIPDREAPQDSGRVLPDVAPPQDTAGPDASSDAESDGEDDASEDVAIDVPEDAVDTTPDTVSPDVSPDAVEDSGPCRGLGCACTISTQGTVCGGLQCVDGVCCESSCIGTCRSCDVPGSEGYCSNTPAGVDPDDECSADPAGTCGRNGHCDGAGACAYYGAEASCDDGEACSVGDVCDGTGSCRGEVPSTCGPGAGNECCVGTCTDGAGCTTTSGACPDTCGGNELVVGAACNGCGSAGAVGTCNGGTTHSCDEDSHTPCAQVSCGGTAYFCTNAGGTWAWRTSRGCDDDKLCTYDDQCVAGACDGTPVTCDDTVCADRECNGTATCSVTPNTGASCDDGNPCSYNDSCNSAGACVAGGTVTCTDTPCIDRACTGGPTCSQTILTGSSCDDGNACTYDDTCNASGVCTPTGSVTCDGGTTCMAEVCNGTPSCASAPQNVGGSCDDGNAATDFDVCLADGTCRGDEGCPPPAEACVNGSESREGCSNARTISRLAASSGGWSITDDTCRGRDRSDESGSCYDAGYDHMYRIYMREGELITARLIAGRGCDTTWWDATLKIYESTSGCGDTGCPREQRYYCEDYVDDETARHTATKDGWVTIIVDGSTAFDDDGDYQLIVGLGCRDGDCSCLP